jgi:hypothetical protein
MMTPLTVAATQASRQGGQEGEAQGKDAQAPEEEDCVEHVAEEEVD